MTSRNSTENIAKLIDGRDRPLASNLEISEAVPIDRFDVWPSHSLFCSTVPKSIYGRHFDRVDGRDLESSCRMFGDLTGLHQLLCNAHGGSA